MGKLFGICFSIIHYAQTYDLSPTGAVETFTFHD